MIYGTQSKFYKDKISGKATVAMVNTVLNKGTLGPQYRRLQVFFPFMGATCTEHPDLLLPWCNDRNDVFLYLHHENEGEQVLGDDVCDQLRDAKKKRAKAP